MPNERTIQAKKEIVDQLKAKLDSAVTCVVVDYKGISVEDDTKLRKQLREAGVDYFVAKNTMLRLAAKEAGYEGLNEYFEGTTAVAISDTDPVSAAKILNEVKDELSGDVRLVFQPAEETAVGALQMMKEHALDGVDAIYGVHVWGTYDAPGIAFPAGNLMACCHGFTIEVEGKSAHASAPHEGVDAVMVASSILQSIQQLVSRMNDPLNPLVITVGKVTAGNRWNVLAGHATLEGTVRTFLTGTQVEDALRKVAECTAAAFGAKATLSYQYMTEPVINSDEQLNRIAQTAVTKLYGKESLITPAPLMGSEDFSWFGKDGIPYIYGFVASHNKDWDYMYGNHHEKYDVDETILHRGAAVAAQFAADYLAETAQQ